jgi:glutaredoxin 3
MKKIQIYSTPSCHYCNLTKDLLKSLGAEYEDYNVNTDAVRRQELIDSGAMGVPLIKITDDAGEVETMNGFDEERLRELFTNTSGDEAKPSWVA